MKKYRTTTIEETETVYSLLRETYPDKQIDIEFNDNTKQYTLSLTNKTFKQDPEVPVDIQIKIVYGDSVTGDTPLLLKKDNRIFIETISDIFDETQKIEYPGFKMFDNSIRLEKEYSLSDYQVWTNVGWVDIRRVIRHKCDKKMYRIMTHTGCIDVSEDHSLITEHFKPIKPEELTIGTKLLHSFPRDFHNNGTNNQITKNSTQLTDFIPDSVLNGDFDERLLFLHNLNPKLEKMTFQTKISAQRMYYLLRSLGFFVKIHVVDKNYILSLDDYKGENHNKIESILLLENTTHSNYIYDLETDIGRFGAGIGELQCFNTDSVFLSLNYNRDDFDSNRKDTFRIATICGEKLTNEIFNRPPIEMEFEKVFQPFILLTKKRYIGKKFEDTKDPFKLKCIDTKGIALTRRDYCKFVKRCYQEIIDVIVDTGDLHKSVEVFKRYVDKIYNYDIDFDDLVISAMLAKEYSCGLCKKKTEWTCIKCDNCKHVNSHLNEYCEKCKKDFSCIHRFSLAHVNLAVNLLKRKEEIGVNDRIQFLFVEGKDSKQKKGELAEEPKYAKENGLRLNRVCYLEQLGKTILGFFKITLEKEQELLGSAIDYINERLRECDGKCLKPSDFKIDIE